MNVFEQDIYFQTHGGIALGLSYASQLARSNTFFITPEHIAIPISELNPDLTPLVNCTVVLKASMNHRDFSSSSARGIGSSRKRAPFNVVVSTDYQQDIVPQFNDEPQQNLRSIVLQNFVKLPESIYAIVHADSHEMLVEFGVSERFLVHRDAKTGQTSYETSRTDGDLSPLWGKVDIDLVMDSLQQARQVLGFDFNIEGFANKTTFSIIQLRNLMHDEPYDPSIAAKIAQQLTQSPSALFTRFVWGAFDHTANIQSLANAQQNIRDPQPILVLRDETTLPWESDVFKQRSSLGLSTIFIDPTAGTTLSHDPSDLPVDLGLRSDWRRICTPQLDRASLEGKRVMAMSSGHEGLLVERN